MLKGIGSIALVSALMTIAGTAGRAHAEESNDASEPRAGADEGRKNHGSRDAGDEGKKRSGARNDRRANGKAASQNVPMRMNEAFTFSLGGGCDYTSTVRGTVKPARNSGSEEPKFVPSLTVNAWISCQNNTELRVTDNSLREIAMTRAELEQAIELRASLLAESSASRCAYVPDFALSESKLSAGGISYLCPTNAALGAEAEMQEDATRPAIPPTDVRSPANARAVPETKPAHDARSVNQRGSRDRSTLEEPR